MYKDYEFAVGGGVLPGAPVEEIIEFPACTIDAVVISFPKGPNREVYVRVLHELEAVFPQDQEEWINGEDETVIAGGPWANWDGLYRLRIQLCGPGARMTHKVIFRFNLSAYKASSVLSGVLDSLSSRVLSWS